MGGVGVLDGMGNFWIGKGRSECGSEIPDAVLGDVVLGNAVAATCGERLKGRELVGPPWSGPPLDR